MIKVKRRRHCYERQGSCFIKREKMGLDSSKARVCLCLFYVSFFCSRLKVIFMIPIRIHSGDEFPQTNHATAEKQKPDGSEIHYEEFCHTTTYNITCENSQKVASVLFSNIVELSTPLAICVAHEARACHQLQKIF